MNTCYEIYETIQINTVTQLHRPLILLLQEHISRLCGYQVLDKAGIYNLRLTCGLDMYNCAEDSSVDAWKNMIAALDTADGFILSMSYCYEEDYAFNMDNIGIKKISQYLEEQPDEYLNQVYYKTYSWASDSDNSGELSAYGLKAGRLHRGKLEYLSLFRIPEGRWFNQQAAFAFEFSNASMDQISKLEPLCQQLMSLSVNDDFDVEGSTITYSMNNAFLNGIAQVEKYIDAVKGILEITGQEQFDTYFFDSSANNYKLLHITIFKDKEHHLEIAEL